MHVRRKLVSFSVTDRLRVTDLLSLKIMGQTYIRFISITAKHWFKSFNNESRNLTSLRELENQTSFLLFITITMVS